jgi:hypothetical protein
MLGISLYSYPNSTSKNAVFIFIVYVFSSTKLEIRAEQVMPVSEGGGREEDGGGLRGEK